MSPDPKRPPDNGEDVATLVRIAGPRPAVPPERSERVRQAARASWQHVVEQRSRGRRARVVFALATAASVALLITAGILRFRGGAPATDPLIRVESLHGTVWVNARSLAAGEGVVSGSELTTGEAGLVAVRLASGHSVRLAGATVVRLVGPAALALDRGTVYVDSGEREGQETLTLHTPVGDVEEIGTQFELQLDEESLRIRVREGSVLLHQEEQVHEVKLGTELVVDGQGKTTAREIPAHGPEWEWISGVTPMLDLEGRTARAFLDWVARERGLGLRFADDAVARAAAETVLGGTIEGLTLDEALAAVLPTCRMVHRIEDGDLVIEAVPES